MSSGVCSVTVSCEAGLGPVSVFIGTLRMAVRDEHGCQLPRGELVMVNVVCQLDLATECPKVWLNIIFGCVYEGVSGRGEPLKVD